MIRYSRNFLSRFSRPSVFGTVSLKEASQFSSWRNHDDDDVSARRTFANFSIYKGKAALSAQPVLPKFNLKSRDTFVKKGGSVMLMFMPAAGPLKYDYTKKQLFALSPTEVGRLISLGDGESCEFFHDPSMKSSNEGQVRKTLSVSPTGNDGDYFFKLGVSNVLQNSVERFSVPVTKAEFSVLRTSFSFILPHILGWGRVVADAPQPSKHEGIAEKVGARQFGHDVEWNR